MDSRRRRRIVKAGVIAALLAPAGWLVWAGLISDGLGAEPIEEITHLTGEWALRLLLLTLAVTPARRLLGWNALAPYRRTFGLAAFFYASLHLATYVGLDHFFDWPVLVEDVLERPFITVGFGTFLLLVPLALTSTRAMVRRLGQRWVRLHRLVYLAGIGAVVHYFWGVKADLRGPLLAAAVLAVLLGTRLWWRRAGLRATRTTAPVGVRGP